MSGAAVTYDTIDATLNKTFANMRSKITGIQANGFAFEAEAFALAVQAGKIGLAVMDVAGSDEAVQIMPQSPSTLR